MTEPPQERTTSAVRPYVITGGRADAGAAALPWESLVRAAPGDGAAPPDGVLQPEHRALLGHCRGLISVGEVAARIGQPLPVVQVLLADLAGWGLIETRPPVAAAELVDVSLLRKVLNGLEEQL